MQKNSILPYAVHVNFNEAGLKGKRHRLRQVGLWLDAPSYFESTNGFIQVENFLHVGHGLSSDIARWTAITSKVQCSFFNMGMLAAREIFLFYGVLGL